MPGGGAITNYAALSNLLASCLCVCLMVMSGEIVWKRYVRARHIVKRRGCVPLVGGLRGS